MPYNFLYTHSATTNLDNYLVTTIHLHSQNHIVHKVFP